VAFLVTGSKGISHAAAQRRNEKLDSGETLCVFVAPLREKSSCDAVTIRGS
jgi:hypothetical protein